MLDVMARLAAGDRQRLRGYVELRAANPTMTFMTWLRIAAKRVGIDYQRSHGNYIDRRRSAAPASWLGKWIEPGTFNVATVMILDTRDRSRRYSFSPAPVRLAESRIDRPILHDAYDAM